MKEKLKKEKGITLIALVITIIVLLILAIVTIRIITNENIIGHANNAVTAYNEAQINEIAQLTWVEQLMQTKGGSAAGNSENSSSNSGNTDNTIPDLFVADKNNLLSAGQGESGYMVAYTSSSNFIEVDMPTNRTIVNYILIFNTDTAYINTRDTAYLDLPILGDITTLKVNTWYSIPLSTLFSGEANVSELTEYTGNAPISNDQYSEVHDAGYLQRIINSF